MDAELAKIRNTNAILTRLNAKRKKQNDDNRDVMMTDEYDEGEKSWFKIKLDEMSAPNRIKLAIPLVPQRLVISRIRGESKGLVRKLEAEMGKKIPLDKYVTAFRDQTVWYLERNLRVTSHLHTFASLTLADMKSVLRTLPSPGLWRLSNNVSGPCDFETIVNEKLDAYRDLVDFVPYLGAATVQHYMKPDHVYRLNSERISYTSDYVKCR